MRFSNVQIYFWVKYDILFYSKDRDLEDIDKWYLWIYICICFYIQMIWSEKDLIFLIKWRKLNKQQWYLVIILINMKTMCSFYTWHYNFHYT